MRTIRWQEYVDAVEAVDCDQCGAKRGANCPMDGRMPAHRARVHRHRAQLRGAAADPAALAADLTDPEFETLAVLEPQGYVALQQCNQQFSIRGPKGWTGRTVPRERFPRLEKAGLVMLTNTRSRPGFSLTELGARVLELRRGKMEPCLSSPSSPSAPCAP